MQKTKSKELKRQARENLNGKYKTAIAAFAAVYAINFAMEMAFSYLLANVYATAAQRVAYYVAEVLLSIVIGVLSIGITRLHLNIALGKEAKFTDIFYGFRNNSNRYFLGYILYFVFSLIAQSPTIILINTSIAQSLFSIEALVLCIASLLLTVLLGLFLQLYFYELLEKEEQSIWSCFASSVKLMRGNKMRLLYIYISFIGMCFLGFLSLFIGFLWIEPYYEQTLVCFYMDVTGTKTAENSSCGDVA